MIPPVANRSTEQQVDALVERVAGWKDSTAVRTGFALIPEHCRDLLAYREFERRVVERRTLDIVDTD